MTNHHEIDDTWKQVAVGPCFIEAVKGVALLHFADTAPDLASKAWHRVREHEPGLSYGGTKKVFVRRGRVDAEIVVTEGL
jgi:hypothetical protein